MYIPHVNAIDGDFQGKREYTRREIFPTVKLPLPGSETETSQRGGYQPTRQAEWFVVWLLQGRNDHELQDDVIDQKQAVKDTDTEEDTGDGIKCLVQDQNE